MFRRAPHRAARRQQLRGLVVTLLAHAPSGLGLLWRRHALGYRTEGRPLRRGVRAHLCAKPAHLVRVRVRFGVWVWVWVWVGVSRSCANLVHIVHEDAHGAEAEAECVERRESIAEEHDGAQDAEELLGAYAGSK